MAAEDRDGDQATIWNGVWERWLVSGDIKYIHAATWYFDSHGLQDVRSERIAELLSPYADHGKEWRDRIIRVLSWGEVHKSEAMLKLHLQLMWNGAYDNYDDGVTGSDFWHQYHKTVEESPDSFIRIAAVWFRRAVELHDDGRNREVLGDCTQDRSHYGAQLLGQAASASPGYFVNVMLSIAVGAIVGSGYCVSGKVRDRIWPWISNNGDPFDVSEAILLHLSKSLQWLAKNNPDQLSRYASDLITLPHQSLAYLLLSAWTENGSRFAEDCAAYLIADRSRFDVGYISWSAREEGTGRSAIARKALIAASGHCKVETLRKLEQAIIDYTDELEMQTPRWRGWNELLLLRSLSSERISTHAKLRIEELERKFPNQSDAIVPERASNLLTATKSPISSEVAAKMTDDQWISAMRKYDGSADRFRGGPHELSSILRQSIRADRRRFATLLVKMPDSLNPIYFGAILDGICSRFGGLSTDEKKIDDRDINDTTTNLFLESVGRVHALPGRPCGSAICGCIEVIAQRKLPDQLLDLVVYYATEDPDPDSDTWKEKDYYGGSPYDHGINCVRGQAARAISALLFEDENRFDSLLPALERMSKDPVISVRSCALTAYIAALNINPDAAVRMFLEACGDNEDLCATHPFDCFVHHATATHYDELRPLLRFALKAENVKCVKNAARQIVVASLDGVDLKGDLNEVVTGSEPMRRAAVSVYAQNAANLEIGAHCVEQLRRFLNDDSAEVRLKLANVFHRIKDRLDHYAGFISEYVESKAYEEGAYYLLRELEDTNLKLPSVVCRAAERVLDFVGVEGAHVARREAMVARSVSTLIVRQYEQATDQGLKSRCLDLIDRMERIGYYGIGDELSKLDR